MESAGHVLEAVQDRRVRRADLERLLCELETRDAGPRITIYARAGHFVEHLNELHSRDFQAVEEMGLIAPRVDKSETGAAVFWSAEHMLAVMPPFPVEKEELLPGWDFAQLRTLLAREYVLGVVLLRLGRYAVGVFQGEKLVSSKTDTRYVKGRHSAGGTSQKRFQRIREKQIQQIFDKTCSVVTQQFTPFEEQLDYILLGGERFTLQGFLKRCDYLERMSPKIMSRTLDVREPRQSALESVTDKIWESRVLSIKSMVPRSSEI